MYFNFKRLGLEDKARKTIAYSIAGTVALMAVVFLIPEDINIPNAVFVAPQVIIMIQVANLYQKKLIDEHEQNGGVLASNWKAFGIGVVFTAVIFLIVFAIVFIFMPD